MGPAFIPIMMAFVTQGLLSEPSMIRAEFTLLLSPPSFRIGLILADPTSPHFFQDWIATFAVPEGSSLGIGVVSAVHLMPPLIIFRPKNWTKSPAIKNGIEKTIMNNDSNG